MEAMDQKINEEYIWAMRTHLQQSDTDLWKERKAATVSHESLDANMRPKSTIHMSENYQTKVLASFVPDEIIFNVSDYSIRCYDACLLFGDVSGFTDLCEKYNKTGRGGPSRLTQVLNSYIGSMVLEVMSHGGDVLKFSGDAFLAMWKSSSNQSMQDIVHDALDCALMIQKSYGTYETDVGVFLRVKLAISAGLVKFSLIGKPNNSHYVVLGQPIWDVKAAEHRSSAGEIIVSISAWQYVNPAEYIHEEMEGGLHIKVQGCGANWRSTQRMTKNDEEERDTSDSDEVSLEEHVADEFMIRPSVNRAARLELKEDLRRFIIRPIMRAIDLDEPLEYLTEMRQIVILFINVVTYPIEIDEFIALVDQSYKIVCSVVDEMEGCVNKVSLFDKDLMFVIIFGLRGFKHELESQIGLKCASQCYNAISAIKNVKSTSVAVTTGNTYCGVVGHTLRREYTVISLTVNKAARLMCNYPDKVTCDRETFLHSKMQAKNFILQEYKALKGITNPGPVYEFREEAVSVNHGRSVPMNTLPCLGRDDEIRVYLRILNEFLDSRRKKKKNADPKRHRHSVFVVRGDPRQGKTRLFEEFLFETPESVQVNRFTLTLKDAKVPYQAIQLIFSLPLGTEDTAGPQEKEKKLAQRLRKVKTPDMLCSLNQIFRVNFTKSDLYMSLPDKQRLGVAKKMLKQLCIECFEKPWIIAIDDAEFIDDESWELLYTVIEADLVLLVMTMGGRRLLGTHAETCLKHYSVRTLKLDPLPRWYHAGFACQILGVRAIPPDLEKVIQTRSNGNPGWMESFLVSLRQSQGLVIREIAIDHINEYGLVVPSESMFVRKKKRPEKVEDIVQRQLSSSSSSDDWNMYGDSFRDSVLDVGDIEPGETVETVKVCSIAKDYNIKDVDPELTLDVIMLKTFDSLTSYEQLLLKCSSTMGDIFIRDMLLYVMSATTPRLVALAVQKLFEIRVLSCARGDFTEGVTSMVFQQRLVNPDSDNSITCGCIGLKLLEGCDDLPKYASCGYMRFRMPVFRETTYNLLTDRQKKEFHNRARRYLEKETRRCRSCGNGFFAKILGTRNEENLKRKSKKNIIFNTDDDVLLKVRRSTGLSIGSSYSHLDGQDKDSDDALVRSGIFGFTTIHRMRNNASFTKTFSTTDFSTCQCPAILSTMYSQMLEHCNGAGQTDKMLDVMLEYAYVCIISCNTPQAMMILEDAMKLIDTMPRTYEESEAKWRIPLQRGKIKTLIGYSQYEIGQLDEAYRCFYEAMRHYNSPFPTGKTSIKLQIFWEELKQNVGLFLFPTCLESKLEGYEAEYCDNLSECLSLMCNLFIELSMWEDAELAAVWALNKSLESEMDFHGLCTAYANMLRLMHHTGRQKICIALEVHALRLCHRKKTNIEAHELKSVAKLYAAMFICRLLRSELTRGLNMGYITLRICTNVHAVHLSLTVFPLLFQALLLSKRIVDAVSILQQIDYYSEEDTDNSGKTWYYALCVVLQIETGYCLNPYKFCERFYQVEGETMITVRDPDAERRYFTIMWLWCIRNEEWEAAMIWYPKAILMQNIGPNDSLANIHTSLYFLEGLILYLVCKMDRRNVRAVSQAYNEISTLLKNLERVSKVVKIILPRYYHLKAYFNFIRYNDTKAFNILNVAKNYAEKHENLLELAWIEHSEKAWMNNLSSIAADFWKEHCEANNLIDYHEIELNGGKLGLFTLPIPQYC